MINFYSCYNNGTVLNKYSYMKVFFDTSNPLQWDGNMRDKLEPYLPIIKKNSRFAYLYARFILNERWCTIEHIIMKDPGYATMYAKYVIKERWVDAEPVISKYWWRVIYNKEFSTDI